MGLLVKEKRKNDEPRRMNWWLLVIGIVIGVVLTLIAVSGRTSSSTVIYTSGDDPLVMTVTAIIQGATAAAQGTPMPAFAQSQSGTQDDSIYATATAVVLQATQQSIAPGS
jgi:hypothetical protein